MRKVVYTIKKTGYKTVDFNLVKNLPEHAYTVSLEDVKESESEKQREERLKRMKRKIDAIILNKACVV